MFDEIMDHINSAYRTLQYRARHAGLVPDQIFHIEDSGFIYVICNPVIGSEKVLVKRGPMTEYAPRRNVTMWAKDPHIENGKLVYECGLFPIVAPYLLMKLSAKDGAIVSDPGVGDEEDLIGDVNDVFNREQEIIDHFLFEKMTMFPNYEDGKPCPHPGCLHHLTHPCEGCGRIGGKRQ